MPGLRAAAAVVAVVVAVAGGFVAYDELRHAGAPDRTTVTVVDGGGTVDGNGTAGRPNGTGEREDAVTVLDEAGTELGTVEVRVADTYRERYTGLSDTESLGPDEGMLFVHDREGRYAYVMRDMAFPIDIVFVDANRTITVIHHAETESRPYTRYRGRGKWVLEVPYRWTTRHGVEVGDRVRVEWSSNATASTS